MAEVISFNNRKKDTTETESKEMYTYRVCHRRLVGENIEYTETRVKGNAAGIGPNYLAVSQGMDENASVVFICTLDMLDSIVRLDAEEATINNILNKSSNKRKITVE